MVVESQIEQKIICTKTHRDNQFPCQKDMQGLGDTQNQIVLNQGPTRTDRKNAAMSHLVTSSLLTNTFWNPTESSQAMSLRTADKPVIVVDVGGVLVDFDLKPLLATLSKKRGEELTAPSLASLDKFFLPVQTGKISLDDLVPAINASLGVSIAPDEWRDLLCSIFTGEVPGMKEMLRELKNDFFLVALTNTIETHWAFLLKTYEILKLFDGYIVSCEEGVAKPDPAIYQRVVDRYCDGRLPYFHTDDTPEYVEAARRMGWRSEVFRSPLQFKNEVLRSPPAK